MRRDDPDVFQVPFSGPPKLPFPAMDVINVLEPMITERRAERIKQVVSGRTHRLSVVLEDITDPHNTSAVLRSCDAFGIQRVHIIPGPWGFQAARCVTKGSHRWLDLHQHQDGVSCVKQLQSEGFTVLYASMEGEARPEDLQTIPKAAIVFGNEHRGPSQGVRECADGGYSIPMRGFVDSLNVSVAVAITLFSGTRRGGDLEPDERDVLTARYLLHSVHDGEKIVRERLAGRIDK